MEHAATAVVEEPELSADQFELFCHCEQYQALKTRRIPANAGIHLEPLLLWSSPERRGCKPLSFQEYSPPSIYAVHHKGRTRLVANHEEPAHAIARFTLSKRLLDRDGIASEASRYLTPDHLYVLSHLLSLIVRRNGNDAALFEHGGRYLMGFQPSFLKRRMGRQRSAHGALYDRFERLVSDLSRLRISYDTRDENHQWKRISTGPFFDLFCAGGKHDTFDALMEPSTQRAVRGRGRRYRETHWKVRIGKPLDALLRYADSSNIVAILPNYCELSGRSAPGKWLLLYYAGHGWDSQDIRPRRIETLCRSMYPDYDASLEAAQKQLDARSGASMVRWFDNNLATEKLRTQFIRRVTQGLSFLLQSGFFETVKFRAGDSPSDRRIRTRSYQPTDLVLVSRHASLIEQNIDKFGHERETKLFTTLKNVLRGYSSRKRAGAKLSESQQRCHELLQQIGRAHV